MQVDETALPGVRLIRPQVFGDARGFFLERWNAERYRKLGLELAVRQISHSGSVAGAVRGLHFQEPKAQGKLVLAVRGSVLDVAVDIRRGSPSFGRHVAVELSAEAGNQLWIPAGFAHGFAVLSEEAELLYVITDNVYAADCDRSVRWNDPAIGIDWPVREPVVSAKDQAAPLLAEAPVLPDYAG